MSYLGGKVLWLEAVLAAVAGLVVEVGRGTVSLVVFHVVLHGVVGQVVFLVMVLEVHGLAMVVFLVVFHVWRRGRVPVRAIRHE